MPHFKILKLLSAAGAILLFSAHASAIDMNPCAPDETLINNACVKNILLQGALGYTNPNNEPAATASGSSSGNGIGDIINAGNSLGGAVAAGGANGSNPRIEADLSGLPEDTTVTVDGQPAGTAPDTAGAAGAAGAGADAAKTGVEMCQDAADSARSLCDASSGLDAIGTQFMQMAMMQQMAGASSTNAMCKTASKMSLIMGAMQATRAGLCKAKQSKCISTCTTEKTNLEAAGQTPPRAIDRAISQCKGYEQQFIAQVAQTLAFAGNYLQNKSCAKATANDQVAAPTVPTPGAVDCTLPANAGQIACVCQVNARDPRCAYGVAGNGNGSLTSGNSSGGSGSGRLDNTGGGIGDGDGGIAGGDIADVAANGGQKTNGIGGGGGGGPSGGSGSGFGGSGDQASAGGQPSSGFKTDVVSGVGGGGAGGGGYAGRGGGGGGSGGGGDNGMRGLKGLFNIKDALPDKDKLARGLAGMSNAAANDGITGKMGESLFQKATRQYRSQERTGGFIPSRK